MLEIIFCTMAHRVKKLLSAFLMVFCMALGGHAQSLEDALDALDRGDVARGIRLMEQFVSQPGGDTDRNLLILGSVYYQERDYTRAYENFIKSANKGNATAMYSLGRMYEKGEYGDPNISKAREWYERAAALGDNDAKTRLQELQSINMEARELYEGACKDLSQYEQRKALGKLKKASDLGLVEAFVKLGDIYSYGLGTRNKSGTNITEAKKYYEKAARLGDAHAMYRLARLYENSGDNRELASASYWYNMAAENGDETACTHSAIVTYKSALLLNENDDEFRGERARENYLKIRQDLINDAVSNLEQVANDHDHGNDALACYYMGLINRYNYPVAQEYLLRAAGRLGYDSYMEDDLQVILGDTYQYGNNDLHSAYEAYSKARRNGNARAIAALAMCKIKMQDNKEARKKAEIEAWNELELARGQDKSGYALYAIAQCYRDGIAVKKNKDLYRTFLEEAALTYHVPEALYEYSNNFCMKDKKVFADPDRGYYAGIFYVKIAAQDGYPPAVDQVRRGDWPQKPH